jgi:hypothetical protein
MNNGNPLTMLDLIMICPEKGAERITALLKKVAELEEENRKLEECFDDCYAELERVYYLKRNVIHY